LFYKAIKCQENLDYMFPERNHPWRGAVTPATINIVKLFREGYSQKEIADKTNEKYNRVHYILKNTRISPVRKRVWKNGKNN